MFDTEYRLEIRKWLLLLSPVSVGFSAKAKALYKGKSTLQCRVVAHADMERHI